MGGVGPFEYLWGEEGERYWNEGGGGMWPDYVYEPGARHLSEHAGFSEKVEVSPWELHLRLSN